MYESDWIYCPLCGSKTRDKIRADTTMKHFPVFCPKCKQEILINVEQFQITVIQEPAAKPQSQRICR
ncbi:cysteine-rich KTR domain-containing protein [Schaedlerella arabinosiphila]|uniref:cysteine-rich KTR domain-containing protein n=1 Tax=Schaedlerella arabinosiphila TaxID=2044587 RepID=UPI00255801D4|nr:cysteine-rich KTR domain-containing protein [Schaedlerella arabinosiphila]